MNSDNNKYFVYRLAQQKEKSSYHFVDVDMDSSVTKNSVYYGILRTLRCDYQNTDPERVKTSA